MTIQVSRLESLRYFKMKFIRSKLTHYVRCILLFQIMSLEAELLLVMLDKKHDKHDRTLFVLKLFSAGQKLKLYL